MKNIKKTIKNDIILVFSLLVLAGALWLGIYLTRTEGSYAVVSVDGTEIACYPLSEDREVAIEGVNGGTNLLFIQDGKARMEEASCPDKICIRQGEIFRTGETITCLPNRVLITITGEAEEGVDAIS